MQVSSKRRLRIRDRLPYARLSEEQVYAAYRLYHAGMSVPQLARLGWQRWGYASQESAEMALYRAFSLDGLPTRTKREAARLREARGDGIRSWMTEDVIAEARDARMRGESVRAVARRRWQELGYASPDSCAATLYAKLVMEGLRRGRCAARGASA